ncbi:hypothetical protein ACFQXB_00710 [Plastorhodobacter daqingensis]|uniref:Uncharacterized protein n=1 Tax=Plastorhodobacter daqingensis TaxID=1387281 RepID=A0ABW2UFC9_9RHOB
MLYVDIPTQPELQNLVSSRHEASVSIYLHTTPETQNIETSRLRLGHMLKEAEEQLEAAGTPKRTIWPIAEQVNDLLDDDGFWSHQANSLAVLVTPDRIRTFRLPNRLPELVQVSDRFHLKPLIRAVSVPQHAFVLALAENEVRLIEVTGDLPAETVRVPDMPKTAADANHTASVNSRSASGRIHASEGQKILLRNFCRQIDAALRPILSGRTEPLILAAAEPLKSIFRSVSSYPHLSEGMIETSPVNETPSALAEAARPILDRLHQDTIRHFHDLFAARQSEGRAITDISDAARAATFGAIDTLLVDIDDVVAGTVDEAGAVTFDAEDNATNYGVVDEIAGRVLASGGRVLGVRRADIPQDAALAAVLRYAV